MISICIPVYNFNITLLVKAIEQQKIEVAYELVVIDDCSQEVYKTENKKCLQKHTYIELPKNIGRSKIRNLFKQHTSYQYLLFMDCDSMIVQDDFIQKYINSLELKTVIYGGRVYPATLPSQEQLLSWKYGVKVESKNAEERSKNPYLSFMTNNFLIDRSIFDHISFNESIDTYGHEDTYFGYELSKNNIKILHIENPVLNIDIETNQRFFVKNEEAIKNLIQLKNKSINLDFTEHVRLLEYYKRLNSVQKIVLKNLFLLVGPTLKKRMIAGFYSCRMLKFYKLGYLINSCKN